MSGPQVVLVALLAVVSLTCNANPVGVKRFLMYITDFSKLDHTKEITLSGWTPLPLENDTGLLVNYAFKYETPDEEAPFLIKLMSMRDDEQPYKYIVSGTVTVTNFKNESQPLIVMFKHNIDNAANANSSYYRTSPMLELMSKGYVEPTYDLMEMWVRISYEQQ